MQTKNIKSEFETHRKPIENFVQKQVQRSFKIISIFLSKIQVYEQKCIENGENVFD